MASSVLEELLIQLRVDDGRLKSELAQVISQARKAGQEGERALKPFASSLERMRAEVRAGIRPLSEYREELKRQERALKDTASSQDKATGEYKKTVTELANVKRELASVTTELKTQETIYTKLGGSLTRLGGILSIGVTAPLTVLGATGVRSAMQLEVFQQSLTTLIGNAEDAKRVFNELYEFDTQTTFNWPSLTKATTLLAAFNVSADDLIPTLGRLGDISAAVNMNIDELAEIYSKAKVQGRLFMEDINQLTGRGIPIIQELARQFGVTEDRVRGLVETGQVGFGNIEQAFVSLTSEGGRFFNMMASQTDTTQGKIMSLRKEFEQITDLMGESLLPTINRLVDAARGAVEWFTSLDEGTQQLIINTGLFAAAIGPLIVGLGQAIIWVGRLRAALALGFGPAGWATLGVVAIAGLAAALAGRPDSLDRAALKASDALAGGDKDTIVGALDEVIDQLDGPTRDAFQYLRDDLVKTGDVGVEQTQRIARALALMNDLASAQRAVVEAQASFDRASAAGQALGGETGTFRGPDGVDVGAEPLLRAVQQSLNVPGTALFAAAVRFNEATRRFELDVSSAPPGDVPRQVTQALEQANREFAGASGGAGTAIAEASKRLAEANSALDAVIAKINEPSEPNAPGGGGGSGGAGAAGGEAQRTAEEIAAAVARSVAARLEAEANLGGDPYGRSGANMRALLQQREAREAAEWADIRSEAWRREVLKHRTFEQDAAVLAFDQSPGAALGGASAGRYASLQAANTYVESLDALSRTGREVATVQRTYREKVAALTAEIEQRRVALARSRVPTFQPGSRIQAFDENPGAAIGGTPVSRYASILATSGYSNYLEALNRAGRALAAQESEARVELIKAITEQVAQRQRELDMQRMRMTGEDRLAARIQAFDENPGAALGFTPAAQRFSNFGQAGVNRDRERMRHEGDQLRQAADILAKKQTDAALEFASTVVGAGRGFASAIGAFQAGNVGGGVSGLFGAASGIASLIPTPGGQLVSGILSLAGPILGDLINLGGPATRPAPTGGLFGTERQSLINPDIALAIGSSQASLGPAISSKILDAGNLFMGAAGRIDSAADKFAAAARNLSKGGKGNGGTVGSFALADALRP